MIQVGRPQDGDPAAAKASSEASAKAEQANATAAARKPSADPHVSLALYEELLSATQRCLLAAQQNEPITLGHIPALLERLIDRIQSDDTELFRLATTEPAPFSLASHGVHVAILTVHVGSALRYEKQKLMELAMAGLLNDIGMVKCIELLNAPTELTPEQRSVIRQHPVWGYRLLEQCADVPASVREMILQEHERADGSGYPHQFAGSHVHEDAQLLGLLDVYEALTHDRPHRKKIIPSEAIRVVVENHRHAFRRDLLRAFLRSVPLYPVDSWVELNTGDMARVIATCSDFPLSPTVSLCKDRTGNSRVPAETVDLMKDVRFSIIRGIPEPGSPA